MGLKIHISSLSVIGLSKNAGKTTVLNAFHPRAPSGRCAWDIKHGRGRGETICHKRQGKAF